MNTYTQLIPAALNSFPVAEDTSVASSSEPVAASAIAPGLHACNQRIVAVSEGDHVQLSTRIWDSER